MPKSVGRLIFNLTPLPGSEYIEYFPFRILTLSWIPVNPSPLKPSFLIGILLFSPTPLSIISIETFELFLHNLNNSI